MTEPSLPELETERERLYAQLSAVGDFRRGSVSEKICEARPAAVTDAPCVPEGEKRG